MYLDYDIHMLKALIQNVVLTVGETLNSRVLAGDVLAQSFANFDASYSDFFFWFLQN